MIQKMTRWRTSDSMGVTIEVFGDDGSRVALVGDEVPKGASTLTDEEYLSVILATFINQKKGVDQAAIKSLSLAETAETERNAAREELLSSGISATTVDIMLPEIPARRPKGFSPLPGTRDHLMKAHLISEEQAQSIIDQVMSA